MCLVSTQVTGVISCFPVLSYNVYHVNSSKQMIKTSKMGELLISKLLMEGGGGEFLRKLGVTSMGAKLCHQFS